MMRAAIVLLVLLLSACGGGAPASALTSEIVLTQPGQIVAFADTGKHDGDTAVALTFGLELRDFIKCVPDGHMGVMLHADLSAIATHQYRGAGWILGNIFPSPERKDVFPSTQPFAVTETFAVGAVPPEWPSLITSTTSPTLHDGSYNVSVQSAQTPDGNMLGYTIRDERGLAFAAEARDANPVVNMNEQALAFFNAAGPANCDYQIRVVSPSTTWTQNYVAISPLTQGKP